LFSYCISLDTTQSHQRPSFPFTLLKHERTKIPAEGNKRATHWKQQVSKLVQESNGILAGKAGRVLNITILHQTLQGMALVKPIGNKVFPIIYCKKYAGHQKFGKTQIPLHKVIKCRPSRTYLGCDNGFQH
jgi:hypothetical protein